MCTQNEYDECQCNGPLDELCAMISVFLCSVGVVIAVVIVPIILIMSQQTCFYWDYQIENPTGLQNWSTLYDFDGNTVRSMTICPVIEEPSTLTVQKDKNNTLLIINFTEQGVNINSILGPEFDLNLDEPQPWRTYCLHVFKIRRERSTIIARLHHLTGSLSHYSTWEVETDLFEFPDLNQFEITQSPSYRMCHSRYLY